MHAECRRFDSCHLHHLYIETTQPTAIVSDSLQIGSKPLKSAEEPKSGTKLEHFAGFVSVKEAARLMGVTPMTVRRWCDSGKLPAKSKGYGSKITYQISRQVIENVLKLELEDKKQAKPQAVNDHKPFVKPWLESLSRGTLNGKVYSQRTMDDYSRYAVLYFKQTGLVSVDGLSKALMKLAPQQFAKREHYYKAVFCFSKYLIQKQVINGGFLDDIKHLKPKRHLAPKRHTVDENGLVSLYEACETPLDNLLVILLSQTGIRCSEACQLKTADIDLDKKILVIRKGKGGKTRTLGLTEPAINAIKQYLECRSHDSVYLLLDKNNRPMGTSGIYQRVERIGSKSGVKVSPHALRRAFVTLNANKGRPLQMLQIACGHSNITTTRSYCLTSEQEVIEAMKGWL